MHLKFLKPKSICPLCASSKFRFAYYAKYKNLKTSYDLCVQCHSVFQNPSLTRRSLLEFYNSTLYWGTDKSNSHIYYDYLGQKLSYIYEAERRYALIQNLFGKKPLDKKKVLVIGCGPGFDAIPFLKAGANVVGIEPSKEMANYAQKEFGIQMQVGFVEDELDLVQSSFDLAVTWGSSMNFSDPGTVYSKVHSLLKPGGSLFFDFFNVDGPFSFLTYRKRLKAFHVSCAPSIKGIKIVLNKSGFSEIQFHGHFPFYSISLLASQIDLLHLKKICGIFPLNKAGIIVPFPGTYITQAIKK